jgi:hypothetical protein
MLRNPWNGNREVKISRDGTEIEPSVGARLLQEFDAEQPPIVVGPGLLGSGGQPSNGRRMSYPMPPYRPVSGPQSVIYQPHSPQLSPQGLAYLPYAAPAPQAVMYNYGRAMPQQPQQQFSGGQHYLYGSRSQ